MVNLFRAILSIQGIAFLGVASFLSTEPAQASVACGKLGYGAYTLKGGDTCAVLAGNPKLNFTSFSQILTINTRLTRFSCSNARKGQIICHPLKKETP